MERNYTMIIVDDEPTARKYALRQIEWERLKITSLFEAENGLSALELIEKNKPDIMILDIRMPGMDGMALLDEICRRKYNIAIIGLSGYRDFDAARKMLSSGKVVEYLMKPASPDALFEAVTRALEKLGEYSDDNEEQITEGSEELPSEISGRKNSIVRLAKEYVEAHYSEKLSLEQIAAQVYINPSYLSRIFTEVEDIGLNKYIQKVRIEEAKKLLQNPIYKVYEVADMVGYPNFQHFLKIFKRLETITPSKYRENAMWLMKS